MAQTYESRRRTGQIQLGPSTFIPGSGKTYVRSGHDRVNAQDGGVGQGVPLPVRGAFTCHLGPPFVQRFRHLYPKDTQRVSGKRRSH
eukprot:806892-Rhodomonas_salina.5